MNTFVDQVFWTDGKLETLFNAPYSYMNKELATFYGVTPPTGDGFLKVALDPTQRAGIVTQGAFLAGFAKANQTSPVLRGKFVREQFFCQPLPSPPANLVIVVPQVTPGSTTRQRFATHESDPSCSACHKLMDGLGLGFEQYDPLGRVRTQDQGLPVDSSGTVIATDVTARSSVVLPWPLSSRKAAPCDNAWSNNGSATPTAARISTLTAARCRT